MKNYALALSFYSPELDEIIIVLNITSYYWLLIFTSSKNLISEAGVVAQW